MCVRACVYEVHGNVHRNVVSPVQGTWECTQERCVTSTGYMGMYTGTLCHQYRVHGNVHRNVVSPVQGTWECTQEHCVTSTGYMGMYTGALCHQYRVHGNVHRNVVSEVQGTWESHLQVQTGAYRVCVIASWIFPAHSVLLIGTGYLQW